MRDFESLASEHKDAVYRQLIRACGNREDAEDVLVEALLKAYQNLDQLRQQAAFRGWLAQIGRRVCWHLKAREALQPIIQLSALEERGNVPQAVAPSPEEQVSRGELHRILTEAVDQLPPEYRSVYVMRDIEGRSGADVAQQLRISLAAQKSRLHRARSQVRAFLDRRLTNG